MNIAILIPAYNEERSIREIAVGALEFSDKVIVIDDGSTDNTINKLKELPVLLIQHKSNQGKAAALRNGLKKACELEVDAAITIDADGQHKPKDIQRFITAAQQTPDKIIIGARLAQKDKMPRKRYLGNKIGSFFVSWIAGYPIEDSQSGFRLYPIPLIRQLDMKLSREKSFVFETEILIKATKFGYKSRSIKIDAIYAETFRPSHFRPITDTLLIAKFLGWEFLKRGFNPPGLYRITLRPLFRNSRLKHIGASQWFTLLLSNSIILLTLGLSFVYLVSRCYKTAKYANATCENSDFLLVLGMRLVNDLPSQDNITRLDKAFELLQTLPSLKVLVTGGYTGNSNISEARAGTTYLIDKGIDPQRTYLEENSIFTVTNLQESRKLLSENNYQQCSIITNRYHLYRSSILAKDLKLKHTLCAAESKFTLNPFNFFRIAKEAHHVHWHLTYKVFTTLIRSRT